MSVNLNKALVLPAPDLAALVQGRMIATLVWRSFDRGEAFAFYPGDVSLGGMPEQYYHPSFWATAKTALAQLNAGDLVTLPAWGRCEYCQILNNDNDAVPIERLSKLTIWTTEGLQKVLAQRPFIFIAHFRVYFLPEVIQIVASLKGNFIPLRQPVKVSQFLPVLSDEVFTRRRQKLEQLEPPDHSPLEDLQSLISQSNFTHPGAAALDQEIQQFLGWTNPLALIQSHPDLAWIQTIADVGNSSDGSGFEKLVRKSLIKLGFSNTNHNAKASLDPEGVGGAGGLDFYCEQPYPVVGECKATKTEKVPDGTAAQLIKLGYKILQQQYDHCLKIIIAAGELTKDAELTAKGNQMNILRPETLQELVELKVQYPGAIDLLELKRYLEQEPFGIAADEQVNRYIQEVWHRVQLRAYIIHIVKEYQDKTDSKPVGVDTLRGAYAVSNPPQPLSCENLHEILIELSSPLVGYLGRIKGENWQLDRFYFLRQLPLSIDRSGCLPRGEKHSD